MAKKRCKAVTNLNKIIACYEIPVQEQKRLVSLMNSDVEVSIELLHERFDWSRVCIRDIYEAIHLCELEMQERLSGRQNTTVEAP